LPKSPLPGLSRCASQSLRRGVRVWLTALVGDPAVIGALVSDMRCSSSPVRGTEIRWDRFCTLIDLAAAVIWSTGRSASKAAKPSTGAAKEKKPANRKNTPRSQGAVAAPQPACPGRGRYR